MKTIYELQQIAKRLRKVTEADSISPEDAFGLHADVLEYIAGMERNADGLGIHKVYASYDMMMADSAAPVGTNGKPLRGGQLVLIYDAANADQKENGNIYAWQRDNATPWLPVGNMDSVPMASSGNAGLMSAADKKAIEEYKKWVKDNANFLVPLYNGKNSCDMEFIAPDGSYEVTIPLASSAPNYPTAGAVTGDERDVLRDLKNFSQRRDGAMPFRNDDGSLDFSAELMLSAGTINIWFVAFKSSEYENQRYLATYNGKMVSETRYFYIDDSSREKLNFWFIPLPADAEMRSCDLSIE